MTADRLTEAGELRPPDHLERVTGAVAVLGGLAALAVALLATASVLLRWLYGAPIDGDYEYVKIATAVAVFCYLPYTQARRGNIMADTFTRSLPARFARRIDAGWDLAYAALTGFVAWALLHGTLDAFRSGETTMQRQIPIWPGIAVSTLLCAGLAVTAVLTARRLIRRGG